MVSKSKKRKKSTSIKYTIIKYSILFVIALIGLVLGFKFREVCALFDDTTVVVNPQKPVLPPNPSPILPKVVDNPPVIPSKKGTVLKVLSWNLYNFGQSKDENTLAYIAKIILGYDVIAIQEVSVSFFGAQAVAKLIDKLRQKGEDWDYIISDPTFGPGTERYCFIWRSSKVKLREQPTLALLLRNTIDREPFIAKFSAGKTLFTCINFHAVPSSKYPETEVVQLNKLNSIYEQNSVLFMGDFNISQSHAAFNGIKQLGFLPLLVGHKTSIKETEINNQHLAKEYDNIFYEKNEIGLLRSGVVDFTNDFKSLEEARKISDHLAVWGEFSLGY